MTPTPRTRKRLAATDLCRARGCGSYLVGVGTEVHDGEEAYCASCGRRHVFYVFNEGGPVQVVIDRKPRLPARSGQPRRRA